MGAEAGQISATELAGTEIGLSVSDAPHVDCHGIPTKDTPSQDAPSQGTCNQGHYSWAILLEAWASPLSQDLKLSSI